jgi:phosphatidylglycerophosphate synthase
MNDANKVFGDRKRTNLLKKAEQRALLSLVEKVPVYISSNSLTAIGGLGSLIVFFSFLLSKYLNAELLLLGIAGLGINWLGDSLDGRVAYYRNTPRKWYGYALDIVMDWFSVVCIGFGYFLYAEGGFESFGFIFVALYGWAILIAQLRYKITGLYTIDSGLVGPTELRVLIAVILVAEVLIRGSMNYLAVVISAALLVVNIIDTLKLLKAGDLRDQQEKKNEH